MFGQHFTYKILIHLFILIPNLCSLTANGHIDEKKYRFKNLSVEDGLSQGNVNSITKDSKGFIWISTYDGLNKYDGYSFTVYKNDPGDSTSIRSNFIRDVIEDRSGFLWVACNEGLDRYDRATDSFYHVPGDSEHLDSLGNDAVETILEDTEGRLWIGQFSKGITIISNKSNLDSLSYEHFIHNPVDPTSIAGNRVYDLMQDSKGVVWAGIYGNYAHKFNAETNQFDKIELRDNNGVNENIWCISEDHSGNIWLSGDLGLSKISANSNFIKNYIYDPNRPEGISKGNSKTVFHDRQGNTWVGTQTGLNLYREHHDDFIKFVHDEFDPTTLSNNEVWSIYQDDQDLLWLGTYTGGINIFHPSFSAFNTISYHPLSKNSIGGSSVTSFCQEKSGNIWIGLDHAGLDYYNVETGLYTHYKSDIYDAQSLGGNSVLSILEDQNGRIWLGTYNDGLSIFDPQTRTFSTHRAGGKPGEISSDIIYDLVEGNDGKIWIATMRGGLNVYDPSTGKFKTYKAEVSDPESLSNNYLWSLMFDQNNELWIGTSHGLNVFNPTTEKFHRHFHDDDDPTTIITNSIQSLYLDSKKRIWVGTQQGLCLYDRATDSFRNFDESDGLSNNNVVSIVEDESGRIWLGTFNGLSRLDPESLKFKNFTTNLQGSQFNHLSVLKTSDGHLLFGGSRGYNYFHPDDIKENTYIPAVAITDFKVFNESMPLPQADNASVHLTYKQTVISFEFASLNFVEPEQNQYAYQLVGFENEWRPTSSDRRFATYTNLPAGEYTFRVKATNNDGYWNETGASVHLIVHPPWYGETWFKLLNVILGLAVAYIAYKLRIRILYAQKKQLEHEVELRTAEVNKQKEELEQQAEILKSYNADILDKNKMLEDLHRQKDGMIGIVAHDLRSPLNHIKGFSSLLPISGPLNDEQQMQLNQINKLIEQGNLLISDLLYVNGIQQFDIELKVKQFDLVDFIRELIKDFHLELERKSQKLVFDSSTDNLFIETDPEVLRRVLDNIVSNALKFSENGSSVYLDIDTDQGLQISVRDEGPGISDEELPKLFEMFQKLSAKPTGGENSTGLGLSIVKALIDKLGGHVDVMSQLGIGTKFVICLPVEVLQVENLMNKETPKNN